MPDSMLKPALVPRAVPVAIDGWPQPAIPAWATQLFGSSQVLTRHVHIPGIAQSGTVYVQESEGFALASGRLPRADGLAANELSTATASLYSGIRDGLAATAARYSIRMWNFIPGIHEPLSDGVDRYQAFNVGRFGAFLEWLGGSGDFRRLLPTATGVGHAGDALLVFALGATEPGRAIENSRQRPAFTYSRRYGPRPPCFARAVRARMPGGDQFLIGGTASVRGEESVHEGSLEGQLGELFENLASLLIPEGGDVHLIRDARVYYRRPADAARIEAETRHRLPGARRLEFVRAEICRRELLVELEAVADAPPPG